MQQSTNTPAVADRRRRMARLTAVLACLAAASGLIAPAFAGEEPTVDTSLIDFFQAGSQPSGDVVYDIFVNSSGCALCHELDDFAGDLTEIYAPWMGSMMAQSARDPVFRANLVIANQDAAFAGDLCLRCHVPGGWLEGRSEPTDGSALFDTDRDGINCHVCHRMVDPVLKPTSPFPDEDILANIDPLPISPGGGNFIMDPQDRRRGPFELPEWFNGHPWLESPYHQTAEMCGTCHDVSNPVFERQEDGTYALGPLGEPHATGDKYDMFPEQRTYSEWLASDFATTGVDMGGRFGGPLNTVVGTCQDCHMPDTESKACLIPDIPIRPDLPSHEMAGGNTWVQLAVWDLYGESEVDNLNQSYLIAGRDASISMIQRGCSLEVSQASNRVTARVINETGHKLPTGYPEGRRIWIHVEFFDDTLALIDEVGYYDPVTRDLDHEGTTVFQAVQGMDETVAAAVNLPVGPSAHLVFNNVIYFDNRIPPRGFTNEGFAAVQASPVGETYEDGQYWHDTDYRVPTGTHRVEVRVYYQTTSKEFAEFLRDENDTNEDGQIAYDQWDLWGGSEPILMAESSIVLAPYPDGDEDGDGLVDLDDQVGFATCMDGPTGPTGSGCTDVFDFDGDGDVDLADAAEFAIAFGN